MDYFTFFVPITVLIIFIFNRIFYCLFNYEVSKYLRPYCFWWVLLELLVQSNIEYFSFLGFRSMDTPFSFNFPSKCFVTLGIIMFYFSFITAMGSYFLYYSEYGKLARYFLVHLLRFPSSYGLMVIMYGARPFLKGMVHALLYDHWVIQIWCLMAIELAVILLILFFEFKFDNHKSKPFFMMDITYYYFCLVILNILMLCKY